MSAEAKRRGKAGEEDEGRKGCVVAGAEEFTVDAEEVGMQQLKLARYWA